YNINVFKLNDRIIFSSNAGFYVYDDIADRFFRYDQLNAMLGSFASSNKIIAAAGKKYWFIDRGRVALADFSVTGKLRLDSNRFSILNGRMVKYYENISRINNNLSLISIDDGFAIYNDGDTPPASLQMLPGVLVRKVEKFGDRIRTITNLNDIEIPYSQNNIRINYTLPYYRQAKIEFQYYLEGYSKKWSEWTTQTQREFTGLGQGDYEFRIRAKVNNQVSGITVVHFSVLAPWYLTKIAFVGYLIIVALVYYAIKRYYKYKLTRHQKRLREKLQHEKEEFLQKEAIAHQQRMAKMQNEQLQADLDRKGRELANSAMNIVYKNELLQRIHDEITELKDSNGKKLSPDQLRKIQKVI
ncbi:MAG: transcriptional regulator, partial [Sphingobacteriaceae bacterium]